MRRSPLLLLPLLAAIALAGFGGCGGHADSHAEGEHHHEGDGHAHGEHAAEGPHHGHLIELGSEEYHAELTHDEASKTVTVYLLDSAAKASVPIPEQQITLNVAVSGKPAQYKLAATPLPNDPQGQSSCFSLASGELLEALEAPKATGRLNVTIKGRTYNGAIEHEEHGEHAHK